MRINFRDKVAIEGKTLVSCRDGIQEYLGTDVDLSDNNVYKVYRSADSIRQLNLIGVPITNNHVDMDKSHVSLGSIVSNDFIDAIDESVNKTVEIKNDVKICDDELRKVIDSGKNELSLGYSARLVDVRDDDDVGYDFEQVEITPHHLAVVNEGRCGAGCKFKDGEKINMDIKTYQDAKDALTGISAIMPSLDADEKENIRGKMAQAGEQKETDMEMEAREKKEKADREMEAKKKKDGIEKDVKDGIAEYASTLATAYDLNCLADDYSFDGKTTKQIMADCVATQTEDKFTNNELSTAFKMLKKVENPHLNFGDGGNGVFLKDEEIK